MKKKAFSIVEYIVLTTAVILGLMAIMMFLESAVKKRQYDGISSLFGPGVSPDATVTSTEGGIQ